MKSGTTVDGLGDKTGVLRRLREHELFGTALVTDSDSHDGSVEEFAFRLRSCDRRMRALAYSMLGSADLMDDALQDAYLKAFRAYGGFRGESSFATWLGAIVYRTCIDHQRRLNRHRGRTGDLAATGIGNGADGDRWLENAHGSGSDDRVGAVVEARMDVAAALQQLSPDHRAILTLVDLEGLSVAETAGVLDVPMGTVASRLSRARAALKRAVDPSSFPDDGGARQSNRTGRPGR